MQKALSLLLDLYELTMGMSYFVYKKNTSATFDLFVRDLPPNRSYLVAAGLEDVVDYIKNLRRIKIQGTKYIETDEKRLRCSN